MRTFSRSRRTGPSIRPNGFMTTTSPDLSKALDPFTAAALLAVASTLERLKVPYFVIGATARDMLFEHCYGIAAGRKTADLDLAVMVDSWRDFELVCKALAASDQFSRSQSVAHRLNFLGRLPVDIVPFGAIQNPDGS